MTRSRGGATELFPVAATGMSRLKLCPTSNYSDRISISNIDLAFTSRWHILDLLSGKLLFQLSIPCTKRYRYLPLDVNHYVVIRGLSVPCLNKLSPSTTGI